MSAEERDYYEVTCPECKRTGEAQINTPDNGYAAMRGTDNPYVTTCPEGFKDSRDKKGEIVFTCVDCGVAAKSRWIGDKETRKRQEKR